MKKILLSAVAILGFATAEAQVKFGVNAGLGIGAMTSKVDGFTVDSRTPGLAFRVGGIVEMPISETLSFNTGLNYVSESGTQQYKRSESLDLTAAGLGKYNINVVAKGSTTIGMLELPINIRYNFTPKFYAGAGPVLSYLVNGKTTQDAVISTDAPATVQAFLVAGGLTLGQQPTETRTIKFDGKNPAADDKYTHMKAFDLGANVFVGYEFTENVRLQLGYNTGFINLSPTEADGTASKDTFKTGSLILGAAYTF